VKEGEGKREREGPPGYYGFHPGSRGARIVTVCMFFYVSA